jgi:hypothetical protein
MRRRLLPAVGCAVALAVLAVPAAASAAELYAPSLSPEGPARPLAGPMRDTMLGASAARASVARVPAVAKASAQRFYSTDGQGPIDVDLSPSYGPLTQARVQPYVDFLASRQHGAELKRLTLFVVTPAEVQQICSPNALACYVPSRETMVVPGEQTPQGEVSVEYVITHEYGHHVATNRANTPWTAVAWGPKYWATQRSVCAGVAEWRYFPGDQGENYVRNPGENWAETYAQLHYRNVYPWQFDSSFSPDESTFFAAQRDVTAPWTKDVSQRRSGSLTSRRTSKTFPVTTTLDGRLRLTLDGPSRANFDLQVVSDGRTVVRSRRSGSEDTLTATDCQVRQFQVRVVRRSGSGRFTLRIRTPG